MSHKNIFYIALALAVVVVVVLGFRMSGLVGQDVIAPEEEPAPTGSQNESLGASLYEGAQNPIQKGLDNSNPFEDSYKNPFE